MGAPYIVPTMITDVQMQYIEEVLGTSLEYFHQVPARESEVLVVTNPLQPDELILLRKILASVQLTDYRHLETNAGELPLEVQGAKHILHFVESAAYGRGPDSLDTDFVHWTLPPLVSMVGLASQVAESKKLAWSVMQRFGRERAP